MSEWDRWVSKCSEFVEQVGNWPLAVAGEDESDGELYAECSALPPLGEAETYNVERLLGGKLPQSLRSFYLTGTASMDCKWLWQPASTLADRLEGILGERVACGGPSIIDARTLPQQRLESRSSILGTWSSRCEVSDGQRDFVAHLFPFMDVANGDQYLVHDDVESCSGGVYCYDHEFDGDTPLIRLSESFEQFMQQWESLYYIGPEGWFLRPFARVEADGNWQLDVDAPTAHAWRSLVQDLHRYRSNTEDCFGNST
jgi:hypothetical protein